MTKKNAIMAKVRMPLTHQFFHLKRREGENAGEAQRELKHKPKVDGSSREERA